MLCFPLQLMRIFNVYAQIMQKGCNYIQANQTDIWNVLYIFCLHNKSRLNTSHMKSVSALSASVTAKIVIGVLYNKEV